MRVAILGNMGDMQTGIYILESFRSVTSDGAGIDTRGAMKAVGLEAAQKHIIKEVEALTFVPELFIILKGIELTKDTIKTLKELFPDAIFVNWFFDKFSGKTPIWEDNDYLETVPLYDYFFCSLKGVADKLNEMGYENVKYLDEGCHPRLNKEIYYNHYQGQMYGEDISFCGSIGFMTQHPNRLPLLTKIVEEGFRLKIWGHLGCDPKYISKPLKDAHMKRPAINETHSIVSKASLINLGIDQDLDLDMGHSARVYRVLCAGGLYLSTATKGLDKMFVVNKKGKEITGKEDLVVFYDENDMINKIDFLLENKEIRNKIAKNGQKKVLENHTFVHRIKEMIKIIKTKTR